MEVRSQRPVSVTAAPANRTHNGGSSNGASGSARNGAGNGSVNGNRYGKSQPKPEPKILFQKFFRSVGPRTYAAQVKELANGNHLLVLTEGKRDAETGEVRKTRVFVYGEDFSAFFKLLHETAGFIRANPLSEEVREKRSRFWAKKEKESRSASKPSGSLNS